MESMKRSAMSKAAAFAGNVIPNLVEVGIGLRGTAVCHSARRLLLGGKAGASAPLHFLGKLAHGFRRDDAPLPSGKRGFRLIDGCKDFRPSALTLLP
jgi:hypothetical protein